MTEKYKNITPQHLLEDTGKLRKTCVDIISHLTQSKVSQKMSSRSAFRFQQKPIVHAFAGFGNIQKILRIPHILCGHSKIVTRVRQY